MTTLNREILDRGIKINSYGDVQWRSHIWNFGSSEKSLNEYTMVGVGGRWDERDTGITVRHERDGSWTARVDGIVLDTFRYKTDAQSALTRDYLGVW